MKVGFRTPSIKKSVRARTTGKVKRKMKKAVNPFYGKKGMGYLKNPEKAVKNKVYHKTTLGVNDVVRTASAISSIPNKSETKQKTTTTKKRAKKSKINISNSTNKVLRIISIVVCALSAVLALLMLIGSPDTDLYIDFLVITAISLFVIFKLKKLEKENIFLLQWQNTIIENSDTTNKLYMTREQLETITQQQAENDLRIINDCVRIVSETKNIDTFFERFNLLKIRTQHLIKIKLYIQFTVDPCLAYKEVIENKQKSISDVLYTSYNDVKEKADKLKTAKGKQNKFNEYFLTLEKYQEEFDNANKQIISNLKSNCASTFNELVQNNE